jgi:hypothetical protein
MKGSVLDELKVAYRQAKHCEPKGDDLLGFDLPFDPQLYRDYKAAFGQLNDAYSQLARRSKDPAKIEPLTQAVNAFWKFAVGQHNGIRLFTLLWWWRQDRQTRSKRKNEREPSSVVDEIACLHIILALLIYAAWKPYDDNLKKNSRGDRPSFTKEDLDFVSAHLPRAGYRSTYDTLLRNAPRDVTSFVQHTENFLRLHAFGRRANADLATNEELRRVLQALLSADTDELATRSFNSGTNIARQTTFKIGQTVADHVYIVYFDASSPATIFVNFPHTGSVLYSVPRGSFADYAEQAFYQLVYKGTEGLLTLIPLLFDVALAVPGVVAGGFEGLIDALLQPVKQKVAEEVMDALGLDPGNAGWIVLGVDILSHHMRGKARVEAAEESGPWSRGNENRGLNEPLLGDDGVPPRTGEPATTEPRVEPTNRATPSPEPAPAESGITGGKPAAADKRVDPRSRATEHQLEGARPERRPTQPRQKAEPKATEPPQAEPVTARKEPKTRPKRAPAPEDGDAKTAKGGDKPRREKLPKPAEHAEHRAEPVSSKKKPGAKKRGADKEGKDADTRKGGSEEREDGSAGSPDESGGTGPESRGVPPSKSYPEPPPRVRSARARVARELEEERDKVAKLKDSMSVKDWNAERASKTTHLYTLLEQRSCLDRMVLFPAQKYLIQAKVVGVRISKRFVKLTEDISRTEKGRRLDIFGKGRRLDIFELDESAGLATFHDFKSPSTLQKSVRGGLFRSIDLEAEFKSTSEIGRQHAIEHEVIEYAQKTGGKVIVEGVDPVNGARVVYEVDPGAIRSTVTDYTDVGHN